VVTRVNFIREFPGLNTVLDISYAEKELLCFPSTFLCKYWDNMWK